MQLCERCGKIRLDLETACDCSNPRRADPRPAPIGTMIGLATTIAFEIAVLSIERSAFLARSWVDVRFWLILLLAFAGILINLVAGIAAHKRAELWGARTAMFGIATLIATLLLIRAR